MRHDVGPEAPEGKIAELEAALGEAQARIAALERQQADLQSLFDRAPAAVFLRDPDGRMTFLNAEYERRYGLARADVQDKTLEEIFPPDQAEEYARHDRQVERHGGLVEEEIEVDVEGSRRVFASMKFPIWREGDSHPSVGGIEYDITERRRAREALATSEKRFRHLVEGLKNDVFFTTLNMEGDITYMSPSVENVLGYTQEECLTHWTKFVTDPETIEIIEQVVETITRGDTPEPYEVVAQHKDGSSRVLVVNEAPMKDKEGRVLGSEGIYHDITRRKQAEQALRESEAQLNAILETSPIGMTVVRGDGSFTFVNSRLLEMLDVTRDEFMAASARDFYVDPEERDEISAELAHGNRVLDREIRLRRSDGSAVWCLSSFAPVEYAGEPAYCGWAHDITDRKRAEEAVRESEQRLKEILDSSPIGVAISSLKTQDSLFGNARFREMFGLGEESLAGVDWSQFYVRPEERAVLMEQFHRDGAVRDMERQMRRRDGSTFWALMTFQRMNYEGEPMRLSWYYDITERKEAEQALRLSEERHALAMEGANEGLWDWDPASDQLDVSPRFRTLMGIGEGELRISPQEWLASIHGDDLEVYRSQLAAHLRGDTEWFRSEFRMHQPDGGYRWVRVQSKGRRDDTGHVVRMTGSLADITERKEAEEAIRAAKDEAERALADLKQAQDQLVQAEKMASLGQLTAGIAHEIKNPLNFVNNFAETSGELLDELKEVLGDSIEGLDADAKDDAEDLFETLSGDLKTIANHGQRADQIVKSMLLHARGELSDRAPTPINDLVDEAMKLAYHGERARDKSFQATLEPDFDAAAGEAEVIPQEVTRVIVNLLSNAFYAVKTRAKDSKGGDYAPTVAVTTRDLGDAVEIRVRDNGSGIPEEVKARLFDPFFTTKPTGEGTGLGLSMSFDIIAQQHGGRVEVDSAPGEFTEFVVTLPRRAKTGNGNGKNGGGNGAGGEGGS